MRNIIYIIVVILVISWLLGGFAFNVGGEAIHIIIVIAVILLILNIFSGREGRYGHRWW
ncbi:MAG: lmo0937 family membrane protein [Mucilaginibacter sp.]